MTDIDWKNITGDQMDDLRQRYADGKPFLEDDETELRNCTSPDRWQSLQKFRQEAIAPRIVPGKSDIDLAQDYRQRLLELLEPVTVVINEARTKGLIISFGYSPPDAFGRQSLAQLDVTKKLA